MWIKNTGFLIVPHKKLLSVFSNMSLEAGSFVICILGVCRYIYGRLDMVTRCSLKSGLLNKT